MATKRLLLKRNELMLSGSKKDAFDKLGEICSLATSEDKHLEYGEPIICSYKEDKEGSTEKILLAIKGIEGYQIFEGATYSDEGSVILPEYIQEAIDTKVSALVDAMTAEDGKFIVGVTETDGVFVAEKGGLTSNDKTIKVNGFDVSVNVDGETIKVDENGILSVAAEALTQYDGKEAIEVSEAIEGKKTISVKIDATDSVLSQSDTGLKTTLDIVLKDVPETTYEEGNATIPAHKEIQLIGVGNTVLGRIDATDFIVDGMLESVRFEEIPLLDESGEPIVNEEGEPVMVKTDNLIFDFNTVSGKESIVIDLSKYIDVYTAGNGIEIGGEGNKEISIKVKEGEKYLEVTTDGLATKGLDELVVVEDAAEDDKFVTNIVKTEDGKITSNKAKITADKVELTEIADANTPDVKLKATNVQAGIQELFEKVIDDEEVTASAINKLITVLGNSAVSDDVVGYVPSTEEDTDVIANANSFTMADELLAKAIKALQDDNVVDGGVY